jgi:hypothetical protein
VLLCCLALDSIPLAGIPQYKSNMHSILEMETVYGKVECISSLADILTDVLLIGGLLIIRKSVSVRKKGKYLGIYRYVPSFAQHSHRTSACLAFHIPDQR